MFSNQEKTELFIKYRPLILSQSNYFSNTSLIDQKELFSELCLCFCSCIDNWNKNKGTIGTYLKKCYKNHLINYIKNYYIHNQTEYIGETIELIPTIKKEQDLYLSIFEEHENRVLNEIVKAIQNPITHEKKRKRNWLDKIIHKATGIPYKEIWEGFKLAENIINNKGGLYE